MTGYTNPTLTTDLAAAIAMQYLRNPRTSHPPAGKQKLPPTIILVPTEMAQRLSVFADGSYIGDVMEFGSGWRAYPPGEDYSLPGVHRYSVQAAAALVVRR